MVDLMTVNWARSGRQARGAEPYHYWNQADILDKLEYARTWTDSPGAHFAKFSSVGTQGVLEMLREIADHRTTLMHAGATTNYQSHPVDSGLWNDTLDVVKTSSFHCGGWFGLLPLRIPHNRTAMVVDRPSGDTMRYITWPPTTSRSLLGLLTWFMQSIGNRAASMGTGNSWTANDNMLAFLRGQKATGGYEHIAKTYLGLVYENADDDLLHFYLTHLRGHGPTETGTIHHLFHMVRNDGDSDRVTIQSDLNSALDWTLKSFPGSWDSRSPGHWSAQVVAHINTWIKAMGNHNEGLRWLRDQIEPAAGQPGSNHLARWNNQTTIRSLIGGTRETQITVGRTLSQSITESVTQVEAIKTTIGLAYRQATTEGWTRALTESLSRVESWSNTTSTGTSNTTGGSFGNTTAVTVGGETGAIEEFLLGKLTGEATTTIQSQLHSQFTTHLNSERTRGGSSTTSSSTTSTSSLQRMRESSYQMTQEASTSLSRTVSQGRTLGQSLQQVTTVDGNKDQQIANVVQGLQEGKSNVEVALR